MTPPRIVVPDQPMDDFIEDQSNQDAEQAAVGSLFSIQGPEFEGVEWAIHRYLTRQELAQNPSADKYEWVADVTGELHGADLVAQIGGGTFRFFGQVSIPGRGKRIIHNRKVTLAGPRKNFAWEPPPPLPQSGPSPELVQLLNHQQRQLDKLEMRLGMPTAPAAAPVDPTAQMAATIGLVKAIFDMAPRPAPAPQPTPVKDVLDMLKEGMALRDSASTVGVERTPTEIIMEKAFPAVERLATAILTRRQAPPPPRPAPVETRAEVVTDPAPAAQPAAQPAASVESDAETEARARWSSLVQSLARAITEQREPADFAATAEDILAPDEIAILKLGSADDLVAELSSAAGGRYPVLATEQAKNYVAAVLVELNSAD